MTDSIRILIIEDNKNYLNSLKQALTLLDGVEYSDGYGSFEAFRNAAPEAPDCILLDINLPGMSGLDALPEIKQMMPATEVIMLVMTDRTGQRQVFQRCVDDLAPAPGDPDFIAGKPVIV